MNITEVLQRSINYMEQNLFEPLNYEDVATHVNMSNYHFHRIFSMIVGISANEYIRNRRLSLAGEEVVLSEQKIIDIALNHGYETHESFTKAFVRFHGISPALARKSGGSLKMFKPLQVKIILEGGKKMNYRIEKTEPFKLVVKAKEFSNEIINQEGNRDIPDFWKTSSEENLFAELNKYALSGDMYGACGPINKESKTFNYGIAMKYEEGPVGQGLEIWEVKPTLWAVFKCMGDTPDCIGEVWDKIFKDFLPGSEYDMLDDIDFEVYPANPEVDLFCEVWIPIGKK